MAGHAIRCGSGLRRAEGRISENRLFAIEASLRELSFEQQSPTQRIFSTIWELEAEVNNGGFWQYFFNSSGGHAPQAPEALHAIGANRCADIVEQALSLIPLRPNDYPRADLRQHALEDLPEAIRGALNLLDQEFYGYPDELSALMTLFVEAHRAAFNA